MRLEAICRTQEDQQKLARENIIPEYLPKYVQRRIETIPWKYAFEVFTPPRAKKWAAQNKHYSVRYLSGDNESTEQPEKDTLEIASLFMEVYQSDLKYLEDR